MPTSLSVVVATTTPWPEVRDCLASLRDELDALGGELVLGDGTPDGTGRPPDPGLLPARTVHLHVPGTSSFELRARGAALASGDVVAVTEDHCAVHAGWCRGHVEAHDANPEAEVVTGPVRNGSERRVTDRANYLLTLGAFASPTSTRARPVPPVANLSLKRAALPTGFVPAGWMEVTHAGRAARTGAVVFEPDAVVTHTQSHGRLGTYLAHFHNGRSTMGLTAWPEPWTRRVRRLHAKVGSPVRLLRRTRATVADNPALLPPGDRSMLVVSALTCCHTAGEVVGVLAGPGSSPHRLP